MWKLLSAALAIIGVTGGAPAPAAAQTPINISYQPSLYWALPFYIATEKGWWEELGLEPNFSTFPAARRRSQRRRRSPGMSAGRDRCPPTRRRAFRPLTIGITNDESKTNALDGARRQIRRVEGSQI